MRIVIEKLSSNYILCNNTNNKESKKIYNKENANEAIEEVIKEYTLIHGIEPRYTYQLRNLFFGNYKIDLGNDFYYSISIIPKKTKLTFDYIDEAYGFATLDVTTLYRKTTGYKIIELIKRNQFLEYDRYDYGIIDKNNNTLDTYSIYDYKNGLFEIEFDWKYI